MVKAVPPEEAANMNAAAAHEATEKQAYQNIKLIFTDLDALVAEQTDRELTMAAVSRVREVLWTLANTRGYWLLPHASCTA